MQKGKMNICFGGQAGSEAKGKQAAYLVEKFGINVVAGCLSPNAGHTAIVGGKKLVTHHVPVGVAGVRNKEYANIVIGPAAVINVTKFEQEMKMLGDWGISRDQVVIDYRASVITQTHINREMEGMTKIGSTAQGVGLARSDRIMRKGIRMDSMVTDLNLRDTSYLIKEELRYGRTVMYEMGQGFDLCIDHGVSPVFCTSRNCTPMQAMADMGVPPKFLGDTYAVIRSYPIRVNNRDGSSGPYPSDEITWEEIQKRCGAPQDITEITTTTKLMRRVFEFSFGRVKDMVEMCDPTFLCLQFANYIDWECYRRRDGYGDKVRKFVEEVERITGKPVAYVGTGPEQEAMVDLGVDL